MKKSAQLATSVIVPLPKISTSEVTRDRPGICATSRRGMTDLEFDRKRANRFLRFLRKVSPRNGRTHDCKQMRRSRLKKVFPVKISKMRERQNFFRVKSILLVKVATRVARVFNVAKCANRIFLWNADQSGGVRLKVSTHYIIQLCSVHFGKNVEVPLVVIMIMLEHHHLASYNIPLGEHLSAGIRREGGKESTQ